MLAQSIKQLAVRKQKNINFSDTELALSVHVYAVYVMINISVVGVIWWSFPPCLTDGALLDGLVHPLHLGLISTFAVSSRSPAWMACGKKGRPGHGFSAVFFA